MSEYPKYTVTVKAVYIREMEVEAGNTYEAEMEALKRFKPESDDMFSIDVFGLSPWQPDSQLEDILHEQHKQRELDGD